jgi:hypothetical protein
MTGNFQRRTSAHDSMRTSAASILFTTTLMTSSQIVVGCVNQKIFLSFLIGKWVVRRTKRHSHDHLQIKLISAQSSYGSVRTLKFLKLLCSQHKERTQPNISSITISNCLMMKVEARLHDNPLDFMEKSSNRQCCLADDAETADILVLQ